TSWSHCAFRFRRRSAAWYRRATRGRCGSSLMTIPTALEGGCSSSSRRSDARPLLPWRARHLDETRYPTTTPQDVRWPGVDLMRNGAHVRQPFSEIRPCSRARQRCSGGLLVPVGWTCAFRMGVDPTHEDLIAEREQGRADEHPENAGGGHTTQRAEQDHRH